MDPAEEKLVYVYEIAHPLGVSLGELSRAGDCTYPRQPLVKRPEEESMYVCSKQEVASCGES